MSPIRLFRSEVSVVASLNCSFGQIHCGSHINFGLVNHLNLLLNSDGDIPRVPSAAGFRDSGQCFH